MTTADKLAALPPIDDPGVHSREREKALRARLSLALGVLDKCPCTCFYEFRESGKDWLNVCDRCATLVAMKELR